MILFSINLLFINAFYIELRCDKKEDQWNTLIFYKNQNVEKVPYRNIKFIGIALNIHKDKASKVLTLNRNEIRPEYQSELYKSILKSTFNIVTKYFVEIFKTEEQKGIGSMFLNYYQCLDFLKDFDVTKFNQWQNLKINVGTEEKTMQKIINDIEVVKLVQSGNFRDDEYVLSGKELIIRKNNYHISDYTCFLLEKIIETNSFAFYKENEEIVIKKGQQGSPVSDKALKNILKSRYSHYARHIIPCIERYFKLRLKDNAFISYVNKDNFLHGINLPYPKMLSPYISIEVDVKDSQWELQLNEKLCNWVYENRYDENTTLGEIKSTYDSFIEEFKIEELNQK